MTFQKNKSQRGKPLRGESQGDKFQQSALTGQTYRMIASRYPTVGVFDTVAEPDDLEAIMMLEGWTNDRISRQLGKLYSIPREEWVVGQPNAHIIMAPFCHTNKGGGRFNSEKLGAWYGALTSDTAIIETVYHSSKKLKEANGLFNARIQMRQLLSFPKVAFEDMRGLSSQMQDVFDPNSYEVSQKLADELRLAGSHGILFDSVRDPNGANIAVFKPKLLPPVTQGDHYEYRWNGTAQPDIIKLTGQMKLACV